MVINRVLNFVRAPIRKYEKAALAAIENALGDYARELFNKQIESVNLVQRHSNDKEVCLYSMKGGKPFYDESIKFPYRKEAALARVVMSTTDKSVELDVLISLVDGTVFSVTFSEPPGIFIKLGYQIDSVKLLINPLDKNDYEKQELVDKGDLLEQLGSWSEKLILDRLFKPLPDVAIENALRQITSTLPGDYLELVKTTNGLIAGPITILGIDEARELIMESDNFYIVAEVESLGVFAIKQGSLDGTIYLIDYDEGEIIDHGISLLDALVAVVNAEQI